MTERPVADVLTDQTSQGWLGRSASPGAPSLVVPAWLGAGTLLVLSQLTFHWLLAVKVSAVAWVPLPTSPAPRTLI